MEAKPANTSIEEFEPLCKWQHKEDRDVLEIHLQEFKIEQLKVQIGRGPAKKSLIRQLCDLEAFRTKLKCRRLSASSCHSDLGILKISGEHPLWGSKKGKFYKEVPIPNYFDLNTISAKFSNGCLCIEMPKRIPIEAVFECTVWQTLRTLGKEVMTLVTLATLIGYVVYMYRSMVPQDDE